MRRHVILALAILLLAAVFALLLLPRAGSARQAGAAPAVGHPAPGWTLPRPAGGRVSLASFRGHPVVLNFWATWCTPCRQEMPALSRWYREARGKLVILGVDQEEPPAVVNSFVRQFHVTYPVVLDESGTVTARYRVAALPVSFVIDAHGVIRAIKYGIMDRPYFLSHVRPLLAGAA